MVASSSSQQSTSSEVNENGQRKDVSAIVTTTSELEKSRNSSLATTLADNPHHSSSWIHNLAIPIFVMDLSHCIIAWNQTMEEVTQTAASKSINGQMESMLRMESVDSFKSAMKEIIQAGATAVTLPNMAFRGEQAQQFQIRFCSQRNGDQISFIACFVEDAIIIPPVSIKPLADGADQQQQQQEKEHQSSSSPLSLQLVNDLNVPCVGVNLNREVTIWNSHIQQVTGYSEDNVVGKCFKNFIPNPKHQQRFFQMTANSSNSNFRSRPIEIGILSKDGETKPLVINIISCDKDPDSGRIFGFSMIATDMTNCIRDDRDDFGQPEEDLQWVENAKSALHINNSSGRSSSRSDVIAKDLRRLIDDANTSIFGVDTSGRINEWNQMTTEVTGYALEECCNQLLVEIFATESSLRPPSLQTVIDNALRGRGTSNFELEIYTKSNETRILLVNATTRRGSTNDEIRGVVFIAQDITEACRHDRAVAAMANELRQFIDTANAPIFGIDRDG